MTNNAKIASIEQKISALKQKKIEIERKRIESLARLIQKCGLQGMDETILAGALLEIVDTQDQKKEEWQKAGDKFLKSRQRSKTQKNEKAASQK